jgi:hypothetical protein
MGVTGTWERQDDRPAGKCLAAASKDVISLNISPYCAPRAPAIAKTRRYATYCTCHVLRHGATLNVVEYSVPAGRHKLCPLTLVRR